MDNSSQSSKNKPSLPVSIALGKIWSAMMPKKNHKQDQNTQTDTVCVINESDNEILSIFKTVLRSGVTQEEFKKVVDVLKNQIQAENNTDCIIIENHAQNENLNTAIHYSNSNKLALLRSTTPAPEPADAATAGATLIRPPHARTPLPQLVSYEQILKSNFCTQTEGESNKKSIISTNGHSNETKVEQNSFQYPYVCRTLVQELQQSMPVPQQRNMPTVSQHLHMPPVPQQIHMPTVSQQQMLTVPQELQIPTVSQHLHMPTVPQQIHMPTVSQQQMLSVPQELHMPTVPQHFQIPTVPHQLQIATVPQQFRQNYTKFDKPPPRQSETPQYIVKNEDMEQPAQCLTPYRRNLIPQQRPHLFSPPMRNRHHNEFPYQRNRTPSSNRQQIQAQMTTRVQLFPKDPRRQSLQYQLQVARAPQRISRVMSTREANMHGAQSYPQQDYNWSYDNFNEYYSQDNHEY